jgi:putative ABC transport system permease protein
MLSTLAFKTLCYEWRRFLPAVVAVGFCGLLVLLQAGLLFGIFALSTAYVTRSDADVWVGFPGVQSIDLGRPISSRAETFAWMDSRVRRVERLAWGSGAWRTGHRGMVNVYLVGVPTAADAMALAHALTPAQRRALAVPDAVLIDAADSDKLEAHLGDVAEVNGRRVKVAGLTTGLRGLGGVNVIGSVATIHRLDPSAGAGGDAAYFLVRTGDPADADPLAAALSRVGRDRGFEALTTAQLTARTTRYWLAESGAGLALLFGGALAVAVAIAITAQTLSAAVAASLKEYAALRALGLSLAALRQVVLTQSAWVGLVGATAAGLVAWAAIALAQFYSIPIQLSAQMGVAASLGIVAVALVSGVAALRRVAQADPASLLL